MSKWSKISLLLSVLSLIVLFVLRFILGGWVDWFWSFFVISGLGVAVAVFLDWRLYLEFLTMRTTKHGANMGVLILMSLALVVASNYLGYRFNKTIDVTEEKLNSLSDQTLGVLDKLKEDVTFTVFYRGSEERDRRQQIRDDLSLYTDVSRKIKIRFVNAFEERAMAAEYLKDKQRFAVFAEQGGRRVLVEEPYTESNVTSAIIKVTRPDQKTIYFIIGHGEPDIDEEGDNGLSIVRQGLEEMSFKVAKLNLVKDDVKPGPDSVIAIVGPKTSFLDAELSQLQDYVKAGGRLLIAIDPGQRHNLANLTRRFGIEFKNNYILSPRLQAYGVATFGLLYDPTSGITSKFPPNFLTVFFEASEVARANEAPEDWTYRELVRTDGSLTANDLTQKVVQGEPKVRVVGALMEAPVKKGAKDEKENKNEQDADKNKSMVVVFGDSDFISDRAVFQMGNRDLALNIFADLAKEADLSGIRPKRPKGSTLVLTRPKQMTIISAGVALPVILLILSGFFWYRRRSL